MLTAPELRQHAPSDATAHGRMLHAAFAAAEGAVASSRAAPADGVLASHSLGLTHAYARINPVAWRSE